MIISMQKDTIIHILFYLDTSSRIAHISITLHKIAPIPKDSTGSHGIIATLYMFSASKLNFEKGGITKKLWIIVIL